MYGRAKSVVAKLHNQNAYEEAAEAAAELLPGTGAVIEDPEGADEKTVAQAGADEITYTVVRENRNPPVGTVDDADTSPIDVAAEQGSNVETVGFNRHDHARLRLSANASASPEGNLAAWDENGFITDEDGTVNGADAPTAFVGRIRYVEDDAEEDDLAVVQFI